MGESAHVAVLVEPRRFEYREYPIPETGRDDGILKIEAAGLCGTDYEQFNGHLVGTPWDVRPIIPGHEIIGRIDRVGRDAADRWRVKEGDRVVVEASIPCGQCFQCQVGRAVLCQSNMGYGLRISCDRPPHLWGAYATHMYLHPRATVHKVPDDLSTAVLSLFNPMSNAVRWGLERGGIGVNDSVVIEGPGQRGLLAVVAARVVGAGQIIVTGTKADAHRLSLARSLGADATINVDEADPVERVKALTGGRGADVVLDVSAGSTKPVVQAMEMVRPGGTVVIAGLKSRKPIEGFISDLMITKEINMVGALSSSWTAVETALGIIRRRRDDLARLCTHHYPVEKAETAVRVLGREIVDGPEAVHIHIEAGG
jgi:alcohol dehydrogenase